MAPLSSQAEEARGDLATESLKALGVGKTPPRTPRMKETLNWEKKAFSDPVTNEGRTLRRERASQVPCWALGWLCVHPPLQAFQPRLPSEV